jgi:hypothetical protein
MSHFHAGCSVNVGYKKDYVAGWMGRPYVAAMPCPKMMNSAKLTHLASECYLLVEDKAETMVEVVVYMEPKEAEVAVWAELTAEAVVGETKFLCESLMTSMTMLTSHAQASLVASFETAHHGVSPLTPCFRTTSPGRHPCSEGGLGGH